MRALESAESSLKEQIKVNVRRETTLCGDVCQALPRLQMRELTNLLRLDMTSHSCLLPTQCWRGIGSQRQ